MANITENMLSNLIENVVSTLVKEKLEFIMNEEIKNFMTEHEGARNSRNGYYTRTLDTRLGRIDNLQVPRDRNGEFQTQLFEPYQRREGWLEEAVIHMYKGGMGTRDIATFIESMFGSQYSPTTMSNITSTVLQDIDQWHNRPLKKRYSVLYLDGLYVKLKRSTVAGEAVYFVMGICEEGTREILGFYIGGQESSNGWSDVLKDLQRRGVTQVLLGVFDGLPGLEDAFRRAYPKADVQHCIVHKMRSTFPKIRVQDKAEVMSDLKTIYNAINHEHALVQFEVVKEKWGKKYPKEIRSWQEQLPTLLAFYEYPALIRSSIYTSNAIERMNKEFRKRLKPMNSLTNMEAAEKIIYLEAKEYNEKWTRGSIRGFADSGVKTELQEMFEKRYGVNP